MCISTKHINSNYGVYCPISIGYWTIKSSAKIDIVVIPEEFRQFCPILGSIGHLSKFKWKLDIVQIPISKFLCPNSTKPIKR
ncbi:unnamed protein product, partial [Rotaria magnacalcarata]